MKFATKIEDRRCSLFRRFEQLERLARSSAQSFHTVYFSCSRRFRAAVRRPHSACIRVLCVCLPNPPLPSAVRYVRMLSPNDFRVPALPNILLLTVRLFTKKRWSIYKKVEAPFAPCVCMGRVARCLHEREPQC